MHVIRRSQSTVEITAASCIGEVYGKEEGHHDQHRAAGRYHQSAQRDRQARRQRLARPRRRQAGTPGHHRGQAAPDAELLEPSVLVAYPRAAARPCPSALAERRSARAAQGVHAPDEVRGTAAPRAGHVRQPVEPGRRPHVLHQVPRGRRQVRQAEPASRPQQGRVRAARLAGLRPRTWQG